MGDCGDPVVGLKCFGSSIPGVQHRAQRTDRWVETAGGRGPLATRGTGPLFTTTGSGPGNSTGLRPGMGLAASQYKVSNCTLSSLSCFSFICSFPRQNKIRIIFIHLQGSERKDNETQQKEKREGRQHRGPRRPEALASGDATTCKH